VVHGDLKGVRDRSKADLSIVLTPGQRNILVDDAGRPRIMDFGLVGPVANYPDYLKPFYSLSRPYSSYAPWTAPEILNGNGTYSKEADVFSFAMTMVEVRCGYPHGSAVGQPPLHPNAGFHWRCSIPSPSPHIRHSRWGAAGTADPPKSYGRIVGVDETLLEPGASLAPGNVGGIKNLAWPVSFPFTPTTGHSFT